MDRSSLPDLLPSHGLPVRHLRNGRLSVLLLMAEEVWVCKKCQEPKKVRHFQLYGADKSRRRKTCIECCQKWHREYKRGFRKNNKDAVVDPHRDAYWEARDRKMPWSCLCGYCLDMTTYLITKGFAR